MWVPWISGGWGITHLLGQLYQDIHPSHSVQELQFPVYWVEGSEYISKGVFRLSLGYRDLEGFFIKGIIVYFGMDRKYLEIITDAIFADVRMVFGKHLEINVCSLEFLHVP